MGQLMVPALMYRVLAAELMIWSMACIAKLNVMNSQMGLRPLKAAPTAMPVKPACRRAAPQEFQNFCPRWSSSTSDFSHGILMPVSWTLSFGRCMMMSPRLVSVNIAVVFEKLAQVSYLCDGCVPDSLGAVLLQQPPRDLRAQASTSVSHRCGWPQARMPTRRPHVTAPPPPPGSRLTAISHLVRALVLADLHVPGTGV